MEQSDQQKGSVDRKWFWAFPQIEGVPPSPRGGHSATLIGASILFFGVTFFINHYFRDIITEVKSWDTYISMTPMYLILTQVDGSSRRYRGHRHRRGIVILPFWLGLELSSSVAKVRKDKHSETYMPSIQ